MAKVRLICMDMDGTLLDAEGKIPQRNVQALLNAREKGTEFAICSGRFPDNAAMVVLESGLTCPIIGSNGAEITDVPLGKTIIYHTMLDQAARNVNEILLRYHADYFTFSHKLVATSGEKTMHHSELNGGDTLKKEGKFRFTHGPQAILDALDEGVCKFYISDTGNLSAIGQALMMVDGISLTRSAINNIEIMPLGIDKGTGVQELAALLQIPLSEVMTLGDQDNDLPMLTSVGFGVAMGNAPDDIKRQVRYETARFDDYGVALAIERFVL